MEILKGKAVTKFGSHVSTDDMTSGKYISDRSPEGLAKICLFDLDPNFAEKMSGGGFLIAAKNFGCGSSRESAPIAIKASGTTAVIAEEFARIFYRNCFNIGLPCVECPNITEKVDIGDDLEVDLVKGTITNLTKHETYECAPIPEKLMHQLEVGGLMPVLEARFCK